MVAKRLKRNYIGIEIFDEYVKYAEERLQKINEYTLNYLHERNRNFRKSIIRCKKLIEKNK